MKEVARQDEAENALSLVALPTENGPSPIERAVLVICLFAVNFLIYLMVSSDPSPEMYKGIL